MPSLRDGNTVPETAESPLYKTRAAMDHLNVLLALPFTEGMQDWDIELADDGRLDEFCDLYENAVLNADQRFALMQLIVASLDDRLHGGDSGDVPQVARRVAKLLREHFTLHLHTVEYWCLLEEADLENVFVVTPLLRQIWQERFEQVPR